MNDALQRKRGWWWWWILLSLLGLMVVGLLGWGLGRTITAAMDPIEIRLLRADGWTIYRFEKGSAGSEHVCIEQHSTREGTSTLIWGLRDARYASFLAVKVEERAVVVWLEEIVTRQSRMPSWSHRLRQVYELVTTGVWTEYVVPMQSADAMRTYSLEPPCEVKLVLAPDSRLSLETTTTIVTYKEKGGEGRIEVKVVAVE